MVPAVRALLNSIRPDIVNAHYASGYGTTARLVNFHPWVLSVWGSDVYDFPHKSFIHRWLVRRNLSAADKVASTSQCMAREVLLLKPELSNISITPFGVDLNAYKGIKPIEDSKKTPLIIGTVKTMKPKYGVDTLIEAFYILLNRLHSTEECVPRLELRLVGDGDQISDLKALTKALGIEEKVTFVGRIPHVRVPEELAKLDIYVALSRLDSESFGVAIIEAGAAGRPVIVSDAGGLPEVTIDGVTGYIVPREDPEAAADALEKLISDPALRHRMGSAAQEHVATRYSWDSCINTMLLFYADAIIEIKNKKAN